MPTIPIQPPEFHALSAFLISFIAVATSLTWALLLGGNDRRRTLALVGGVVLVLVISGAAARSGLLVRFDRTPPPMVIMMVLALTGSLALGLSRFGRSVAERVPLVTLVGLQAFRLPLEQVMHIAAGRGIVPVELTYGGYNFDIVTGSGALILLIAMRRGRAVPRALLWAWNVWGLACLTAIAVVAVLSSPMVRAFGDDPRHVNTWVLFVPYVWVPMLLVPIAISSHIMVTRALMRKRIRPR